MSLHELYTELVLRHNNTPHNFGEMPEADVDIKGYNKACGDDIRMFLKVDGDTVKKVTYVSKGCAISQSSASMMSDRMVGKTLDEALEFIEEFGKVIHGEKAFPESKDFVELVSLKGVLKFPNRAHCANLAWETFEHGVIELKARRDGAAS